jgi:ubiquinol-cytochrome c reductase cytochrome b subunit
LPAEQLAAIGYFRKENCGACHVLGKSGAGPDLAAAPSSKAPDWITQHVKQPSPTSPASTLTGLQVKTLATFVAKRDDKGVEGWGSAPQQAVEGAIVYQANQCMLCHTLNGTGMKNGPPLNGLSERRARDWIEHHFIDPQALSPGSTMPAYKFNPHDLDRITSYLLAIPR